MHSGSLIRHDNSNAMKSTPKPQAGAVHYASLEIISPRPTRRVMISVLEPIEEVAERPKTKKVRFAPTPELVTYIPTTNTWESDPESDSESDYNDSSESESDSASDNETRVRRVRFAEEVTITPNPQKYVHWPTNWELVAPIPPAEYSEQAPVKRVRFAASPDLVTYIPNDSSVNSDYDFDENNDNSSENGSPVLRVHFAPEPVERRSAQDYTLSDNETEDQVPRQRSVINRTPTPPSDVALAMLGFSDVVSDSAQIQDEQDNGQPVTGDPPVEFETVADELMTPALDESSSDGSRNASDLDRSETIEDFVFLATHSKKRKRRMRRAFAGVVARLSRIVRKRKKIVDDLYC